MVPFGCILLTSCQYHWLMLLRKVECRAEKQYALAREPAHHEEFDQQQLQSYNYLQRMCQTVPTDLVMH